MFATPLQIIRGLQLIAACGVGLATPVAAASLYSTGLSLDFQRDSSFGDQITGRFGYVQKNRGPVALFVGGNLELVAQRTTAQQVGATELNNASALAGIEWLIDPATSLQAAAKVSLESGEKAAAAQLRFARNTTDLEIDLSGEIEKFSFGQDSFREGESGTRAAFDGEARVYNLLSAGSSLLLFARGSREFAVKRGPRSFGPLRSRARLTAGAELRTFFNKQRGEIAARTNWELASRRDVGLEVSYKFIDNDRSRLSGRFETNWEQSLDSLGAPIATTRRNSISGQASHKAIDTETLKITGLVDSRWEQVSGNFQSKRFATRAAVRLVHSPSARLSAEFEPFIRRTFFAGELENKLGFGARTAANLQFTKQLSASINGQFDHSTTGAVSGSVDGRLSYFKGDWSSSLAAALRADQFGWSRTLGVELGRSKFYPDGRSISLSLRAEREDRPNQAPVNRLSAQVRLGF